MVSIRHPSTTDAPTIDTIYTLLGDRQRRVAVTVIDDRDPPISVRELARAVAARAGEIESGGVSEDRIESVRMRLHHTHLPRLDDADVVDYDAETRAVTSARTAELVSMMERSFSLDHRA